MEMGLERHRLREQTKGQSVRTGLWVHACKIL